MRHQQGSKASCIAFLATAAMTFLIYSHARAYIMPPEQLVGFMAANFSSFKTLFISQSTYRSNSQSNEPEKVLEEKIWLKSPGFYRSDPVREKPPDMNFRRIIMANDRKALLSFLREMGIDFNTVSLTRFGGFIAYRIGKGVPESPILLIEKEKFP